MAVTINGTTGIVTPDIGVDGSTLVIDSVNNRVGVQEDSPSNTLTVGDTVHPSYAPTRAGNYIEIARTSGADAGLLINKNTGQWLVGINNGDGANAPLRFEYAAAGSSHPGLGAGTLGMIIKHDGNVGIGTDSPSGKLQVGSSNSSHVIITPNIGVDINDGTLNLYTATTNVNAAPFIISTDVGGTESEKLRVTGGGNVGIGTSSPQASLHAHNAAGTTLLRTSVNANSTVGFEIVKTGSTTQSWRIVDGQTINGALEFYDVTDSATRMIIRDGKVGINKSNPSSFLHVAAGDYQTLRLENTDNSANGPYIELYNNSSSPADNDYTGIISFKNRNSNNEEITYSQIRSQSVDVTDGAEDGNITFHTRLNGSFGERLRITSGGDIGINQTTPTSQSGKVLHISGDHGGQARIHLSTSASGHGADEGHYICSQGAESGAVAGQLAFINMENRNITFTTGSAGQNYTRLTIQHDGNLNIADGNLVVGTNGHGIDFSADGNNGNMTSELLDDYEEGTWTPTIRENGTGTAWDTLSNQNGTYTKVGRLVTITFRFDYSARATNVNGGFYAWIAGLPFQNTTSGVNEGAGSLMIARSGGSTTPYHMYLISSQGNTMGVYGNQDSTTPGPMMTNEWPNAACQVRGQYMYYVP